MTSPLMVFSADGASFDWEAIKACAARPIKAAPTQAACGDLGMLSAAWQEHERDYRLIQSCRLALAARHEGWTAAAPGMPNPLPPEPMMRPDDLSRAATT